MRIAVDAMGSDKNPIPDVAGGVLAAREYNYEIVLVGNKDMINQELKKHDTSDLRLEIIHTEEAVTMEDKPVDVGKSKPRSSMHVGMGLVRDGQADAFVSMGNTGAALAIATLHVLRRIPGVKRPALSGVYPLGGKRLVVLDLGANADSKADWLVQFALMGAIYSERVLGISNPKVALLSNGEEESKGNTDTREASSILQRIARINYIGNIEPKEIIDGVTDVIVADGFVGNIFVKTFEASTSFLAQTIRDEIKSNVFSILGGILLRPVFRRVRQRTDTSEIGGAPLLGVNGVVIIGHGRSDAFTIRNAIRQAGLAVDGQILDAIREGLHQIDTQAISKQE